MRVKELYMTLNHTDKELFANASSAVSVDTDPAAVLMMTGANLLPQGHHLLAEKLLSAGLLQAESNELKARIHLNLAQLYKDLYELNPSSSLQHKIQLHTDQCLELDYFADYIIKNFKIH